MQSIAILLSHDVCLPLKRKLGFNDKLIGLFKKKKPVDELGWAQILIEMWSKSFKSNVSLLQSKYLQNQEVTDFKLQNWYKKGVIQVAKLVQKEPKITFQIKTQVAE